MIHGYMFVTDLKSTVVDRGHGPVFHEIMYKLNRITGLNITVYHNFTEEV